MGWRDWFTKKHVSTPPQIEGGRLCVIKRKKNTRHTRKSTRRKQRHKRL